MNDAADLTVCVIDDRDIVILQHRDGLEAIYRKDGRFPMLVAIDETLRDLTPSKVRFLAQAWKAAYKEARMLGWLRS
jgi:hypothetical protein